MVEAVYLRRSELIGAGKGRGDADSARHSESPRPLLLYNGSAMKPGSPFGIALGVAVLAGAAFLMLSNASPYVTAAQAKTMRGENLHMQGDLVKGTVKVDMVNQVTRFQMRDETGEPVSVVHHGLPPSNMGDATKIVVVGGMKGEAFESNKLITKCPSKYESGEKPASS